MHACKPTSMTIAMAATIAISSSLTAPASAAIETVYAGSTRYSGYPDNGKLPRPETFETLVVDIGKNVELDYDPEQYGITGIEILERKDRPCEVLLYGGRLDGAKGRYDELIGRANLKRCRSEADESSLDQRRFEGASLIGHSAHFVHAIKMCEAGGFLGSPGPHGDWIVDNFKLKGFSIHGAQVAEDGTVTHGGSLE
ncbi:MAG: hypothetical protein AAF637_03445, partial [Pseudomonadota bacterium]